jgi:hypothetical protein
MLRHRGGQVVTQSSFNINRDGAVLNDPVLDHFA